LQSLTTLPSLYYPNTPLTVHAVADGLI
jgi:hypothetical protein